MNFTRRRSDAVRSAEAERKYALWSFASGMDVSSRLSSSKLVRLLQEWAPAAGEPSRQDVAERLSQWLSSVEAVQLDGALQAIEAYPSQTRLPGQAVAVHPLQQRLQAVQAELAAMVSLRLSPTEPRLGDEDKFAFHHQRHAGLQKQMELKLGALRKEMRQGLSKGSPALRQLVALDAVLEQLLGAREQKLWATVPLYLERRFQHWHQDQPAPEGAWMPPFLRDMREALMAELELRLQPLHGLLEAAQQESSALTAHKEHSENTEQA